MKSAKPLDRYDIDNLTTRSARAWVRVRATVEENERLRAELAESRKWQEEVAEGLGFLNRPEGQSGWEAAPAKTILSAMAAVERRSRPGEASMVESRLRGENDLLREKLCEALERVLIERAACAEIADSFAYGHPDSTATSIGDLIRARSAPIEQVSR